MSKVSEVSFARAVCIGGAMLAFVSLASCSKDSGQAAAASASASAAHSGPPVASASAAPVAAAAALPDGYPSGLPIVPGFTGSKKIVDLVTVEYGSMKADDLKKELVAKITADGWAQFDKRQDALYFCKGKTQVFFSIDAPSGKTSLHVGPSQIDLPKTGCPAK